MFVLILFIAVLSSQCVLSEDIVLGGIFYEDADDMKAALNTSATMYGLGISIKEVSRRGEILEISKYVCELAEEGVVGIIDGIGSRGSENIQAICDTLGLPHVMVQHNDLFATNWSLLNLYPSPEAYNMVLESLVIEKEWRNFTILYVKGHSLARVKNLLNMGNDTYTYVVAVRELSGNDYRDVLINAKNSGYINFVVDCPSRHLEQLLKHAQQVGLMSDEHSYIFVSPDLFTLDLSRYRYGGVNMTGLRLLEMANNEFLWNFTTQFNTVATQAWNPEEMKTVALLVHDAAKVFVDAMKKVKPVPSTLSCEKYDGWIYGSTLMNFMKTDTAYGLTRTLKFDGFGQRTKVAFDIIELTSAGNQTVGRWKDDYLKMDRPYVSDAPIREESILRNKTLKVLISKTAPYAYIKESASTLEGNDRYEGFTIDLINKLSEMLGFNYEFEVETEYGEYNISTGKATGMVYQIMVEKADLGICDFTISAERQSAIDFSTPFMTLGIGILYKQPSKQPPEMFSFMAVFSKDVWLYMMLIQLALGCVMIFVGRISNKEWQNPVPCVEQPEELSNQFSFANSVWLIIGSVMQQGSEIAPIALAPRMITSVWWFFTMVMVASYVGTLVAFLTIEKNVIPFDTVEELYKHKSISYGSKAKGSTRNFFQNSEQYPYKQMYDKMIKQNWLVNDNDDGVKFCENSTYAFFMESTSIEYVKERHCDLLQVGGLLDSKSYGIGMKKKSPYKRPIDDALLTLKEQGKIDELKDLWWKEKRGGGKCGEKRDEGEKPLGMKNMLGAFVVLGAGCAIGIVISILDMLWGVFKRSVKYKTTFKYELIEELKFVISFSGNVKPVKRPTKSEGGSEEALAQTEGKDEIRSLRSLRSKSTCTNSTKHSHGSRHSSRSLSVAFARRREYT